MRKIIFPALLFIGLLAVIVSCKNDEYLLAPPPTPDQSFSEEFESISGATGNGWQFINKSTPAGSGNWAGPSLSAFIPFSSTVFTIPVFSGSGYAGSTNTVAQGSSSYAIESTISNWIVSKPIKLQNGDKIVYYTNSISVDNTPTGIEVRMNKKNNGTNVGSGDDPGDFTEMLSSINPGQTYNTTSSFPTTWTRFEATVGGLNAPVEGRIAFRYYVPANYQYNDTTTFVAIDRFSYIGVKK